MVEREFRFLVVLIFMIVLVDDEIENVSCRIARDFERFKFVLDLYCVKSSLFDQAPKDR